MEEGKTVLITGGAAGIGWAKAELLARRGFRVFATTRSLERTGARRDGCQHGEGTPAVPGRAEDPSHPHRPPASPQLHGVRLRELAWLRDPAPDPEKAEGEDHAHLLRRGFFLTAFRDRLCTGA